MAAISQSVVNALINQTDETKRWRPTPNFKNVENTRSEPQYETFADDSKELTRQGVRALKGWITNGSQPGAASPKMKKKIESGRAIQVGIYYVHLDGSITGKVDDASTCQDIKCSGSMDNTGYDCDFTLASVTLKFIFVPIYDSTGAKNYFERTDGTKIYPIAINQETLFANLMPATDSTKVKLEVTFEISSQEKDENLVTVPCSELGGAYLTTITGLHDVCAVLSGISDTGATVKLSTDFGTAVTGLVAADFTSIDTGATSKIYNQTQDSDVSLTVTETATAGTYTLTWAAQDPDDELIIFGSVVGKDFTCASETPIVIPGS